MPDTEESTAPLSLAEAVNAFVNTPAEEEAETGQSESEGAPEGEHADEELPEADAQGEDQDGEPDEEGQAEEVEEEEQAETQPGKFASLKANVKLPDGTVTSVDELIKGNLRDRDYRQKTMAHAETVKAFAAQSDAVKQKETQINERAEFMASLVKSIIPKPPEAALLDTDPVAYWRQERLHREWVGHFQKLHQDQQQAKEAGQAETAAKEKEKIDTEWETLVGKVPELSDVKKLTAFASDLKTHGTAYGFTPQEIQRVSLDHRQALVLRDAIAWRNLQANKSKVAAKIEGRPPVQRAGTRPGPGQQNARQSRAAMDRLNKTGTIADGVAALLATEKG